jgi:CBS domain-containing protein
MTLDKYRTSDLVVLPPTATVQAASHAFGRHGIGTVLVHDGTRLVGIVTDRDIALRAAAQALAPRRTLLRDVMSRDVAVLPASASEGEAGRLMLERRVRRIPLLDGSALVGIVTLDDLILDEAVSPSMVAAVIRAQLADASETDRASAAFRAQPIGTFSAVA